MSTLREVITDEVAKLKGELETIQTNAENAVASKQAEIASAEEKLTHFGAWLEFEAEAAGAAIKNFFASHGISL